MTGVCVLDGAEASAALGEVFTWSDPQILSYHHPAYQELLGTVLGDGLQAFATYTSAGKLTGLLPYRVATSAHGAVMNAFPFFGCTGVVAAQDAGLQASLMQAFAARARQADIFSATLYTPVLSDPAPLIAAAKPDAVIVKFTQYLDVERFVAWPAKRRADIRRAQSRYTIRAPRAEEGARLGALYAENCRDAAIPPKPPAWFAGALALSAKGEALRWLVAEHDGVIQAGLLYGVGPRTASYILPCVAARERTHQPMALLLDAAIAAARREGARYWNFESSPAWNDPVFKYKQRWGAVAAPFALLTFYGMRGCADHDAVAAVRAACPYYFVAPMGPVGGVWPAAVPLPASYAALSRFLPTA